MREPGSGRRAAIGALLWRLLPWAIVAVAILFRLHALGRLPGVNGDEAWYGVKAQRWAAGETIHWRTPTGNLPGPLQLGSLLLLQTIFPPSFALLRAPALISSLGAMLMAYAIGRRFFDRTTAVIALLLMAALPVNIAYARFGWDPSHVELVILAAGYAALGGYRLVSTLFFALALTVHPTSVFAAPFLAFVLLGSTREQHRSGEALSRAAIYVALLGATIPILAFTTSHGQATVGPGDLSDRLLHPAQWFGFLLSLGRLLSGETIYTYITGTGFTGWREVIDAASLILLGFLGVAGAIGLRERRFDREAGIVAGWLASLALFFLIAGNGALQPHLERYAICLIGPTVLALAVIVRRLLSNEPLAIGAVAAIAMLLLIGFWSRYFVVLETRGSSSATAFWTGPAEPKQVAFERIGAAARTEGPARVIVEDWWLYWPLAYLAAGERLAVIDAEKGPPQPAADGQWPGGTYWLVFAGSTMDHAIAAGHTDRLRWTIPATGHPQALHIWWTPDVSRPTAPPPPARR